MGLWLAILGVALVAGALALWFRWIREVAVFGRRRFAYAMIAGGMALAVAAFAADPGAVGGVLAGTTLALGAVWIALGVLARQSRQELGIAVGQPLPDFTATDADGRPFRLSELRGRPVLLKFFRGHW